MATRIAVFSGLDWDPRRGGTIGDGPTCYTIWGALAWQLGGAEAWSEWQSLDREYIAPGGELLQNLLGSEPSLILLDELLMYIEKARAMRTGESNLGRQTMLFLQTLMEVVRSSPKSALLYSLPDAARETADRGELLAALDQMANRLDMRHTPLLPEELVGVLRTRFFADIGSDKVHRAIATAYGHEVTQALQLMQIESKLAQRQAKQWAAQIPSCYPFHPALIELLTRHWWPIPSYQKTRAALQIVGRSLRIALAAPTCAEHLLFCPGDIPLTCDSIRHSLWAQLEAEREYEALVQREILAPDSTVQKVTHSLVCAENSPLMATIATQLATSLLLYSFGGQSSNVRGLTNGEWLQYAAHPKIPPLFLQTAKQQLTEHMGFIHYEQGRWRFSLHPNLNWLLEQQIKTIAASDVEATFYSKINELLAEQFGSCVLWPTHSKQIPDLLPRLTIVLIDLSWIAFSPAEIQASLQTYLDHCGKKRRLYRNALVFALASAQQWPILAKDLCMYLAIEFMLKNREICHNYSDELLRRREDLSGVITSHCRTIYSQLWIPQIDRQSTDYCRWIMLDLQLMSLNQTTLRLRMEEALCQRFMLTTSLLCSKIAQWFDLAADNGRKWIALSEVRDAFFAHLDFPRIPSLEPLEQAISLGIGSGLFGYVDKAKVHSQQLQPKSRVCFQQKDILPLWTTDAYLLSASCAIDLCQQQQSDLPSALPKQGNVQQQPVINCHHEVKLQSPIVHLEFGENMMREFTLSLSADKADLRRLFALLEHLGSRTQACSVKMQFDIVANPPISERWLHVNISEMLRELDILCKIIPRNNTQ
jgi:hypothetical protein